MIRPASFLSRRAVLPLLFLASAAAGIGFYSGERLVSAEPAGPLPSELKYVPSDAAFFIHADAAKLWNGSLGKSLRTADAKTFEEFAANTKKMFGSAPDSLKTVTMFWPKVKDPNDTASMGIVLVFQTPYDKTALKAGVGQLFPGNAKIALETPTATMAVLLANLDPQKYGKPQPADASGPLTAAIREAGTGKHTLSAGSTLAQLPDEIRGDSVPAEVRPFQPLFHAESISGFLDLDKEIAIDIRVKASSPPRAKEAEKSLGFLGTLAEEFLGKGLKEIANDKEDNVKDLVAILTAMQTAVKNAKYSTEGETTRVTATFTSQLPFITAYLEAKKKLQQAASRAQSQNNLKQIAIALHNYHDVNGAFPPAAVCDKTGKPMLSWRVLILPYLEQSAIYKEFKLDEAWDSDHNKKLIAKMPKTYSMPWPMTAKANETHYRVFVGNNAAFDYLKATKITEFLDGTSNTILVATAKDAVIWTKPDELAFDPDKAMLKLLGFMPGEVCNVALGDGSVRGLRKSISKTTLNNAISKDDGQVLGDDF
jgi:hypothetical protein